MTKRISTTEAARNLGDCLARIKHTGESFILHKNDKPVAALGPLPGARTITFRELWELWRKLPPDPKFADDLEAVNRADRPPKNPWVS
jgi:antitoxin (DNA-binding transcriptional repressor) of toxin-antitoxin stability system